jgi:hypothetical protein
MRATSAQMPTSNSNSAAASDAAPVATGPFNLERAPDLSSQSDGTGRSERADLGAAREPPEPSPGASCADSAAAAARARAQQPPAHGALEYELPTKLPATALLQRVAGWLTRAAKLPIGASFPTGYSILLTARDAPDGTSSRPSSMRWWWFAAV